MKEMSLEQLHQLFGLLGSLRDEVITPEEFSELNGLLEKYQTAREYYLDYSDLCTDLSNLHTSIPQYGGLSEGAADEQRGYQNLLNPPLTMDMLRILAEYEKTAETLELPKPLKAEQIVVRKTPVQTPHRVSKFSLVSLAASIAAVLLFMAYVVLKPPSRYEVATLTDAFNAQWSHDLPLQQGTRLTVSFSNPIQLKQGVIEIESDKGVIVTLEGPTEFTFISPDEIRMSYGRLFANVPQTGSGFSVQTQNSKIIDLGTEFGVQSSQDGQTELHMFKGQSALIAELSSKTKKVMDVLAGQAYTFSHSGDDVHQIALAQHVFAKTVDSQTRLVWRGQKEINLADVVGGGNGFGGGRSNTGINPKNGNYGIPEQLTRQSGNTYLPVPSNVFIDGVFVPGGNKEQFVTSEGHLFRECPMTSGYFYADIANTPLQVNARNNPQSYPVILDEINYSTKANSCIFLHANLGITFDLNAFRSRLPDVRDLQFRSDIGVSSSAPYMLTAGFWVLVDGHVRYHKDITAQGLADTLKIDIRENDRFLTLVTTDGELTDQERDPSRIGYDWCVFGNPVLILE